MYNLLRCRRKTQFSQISAHFTAEIYGFASKLTPGKQLSVHIKKERLVTFPNNRWDHKVRRGFLPIGKRIKSSILKVLWRQLKCGLEERVEEAQSDCIYLISIFIINELCLLRLACYT